LYAKLLTAIEAAREAHEDAEPTTDSAALLMVRSRDLLARCEVIARALVADTKTGE
jgi:hypothetical protein